MSQLPTSELACTGVSYSGVRSVIAVEPGLPRQLHRRGSFFCTLYHTFRLYIIGFAGMAPMMIENENDVEVGESLPPMTAHVSQCFTSSATEHMLNTPGCQCLTTDMESQYWLRRRRRMGCQ